MSANFCILPYVKVNRPFKFANFNIWPDTEINWKKNLSCKRPSKLLDIYSDRKGKPIDNKTIVSFSSQSQSEKIPQLIASLFYVQANKYSYPSTAEDFFFEIYQCNDPESGSHTRSDKFWRSFVDTDEFSVFQSEFANPLTYELQGQNEFYFQKLRSFFDNSRKQNIIYSLYFFYRTQYRNESLFPQIEDIQNYCTAFEILFRIDDRYTNTALANALYNHFDEASDGERQELKAWSKSFYDMRSNYTHGKKIDGSRFIYKNQRHIDIARKVYIAAVNKLLRPGSRGREIFAFHRDQATLLALFSSQKICDDVIKELTPYFGKSSSGARNTEAITSYSAEKLAEIDTALSGLRLYANKEIIDYSSSCKILRLKEAMQSTLSLIDYLVLAYADDEEVKKVFYTEALQPLKEINLYPKSDEEIRALENDFNTRSLHCSEPVVDFDDLSHLRFEVRLGKEIELSMLMNTFTELSRIYGRIARRSKEDHHA